MNRFPHFLAVPMQTKLPPPRKVAIIHDWLPVYGGAERVLGQIIKVFPEADLFTMVDLLPPDQREFLGGRPVTTSFLQSLPRWMRHRYRAFLPLMPTAVEQFDLSSYELVISSNYAVAKGVLTGPDQLHVCYCHSPMRYAWDLQHQYLRESKLESSGKGLLARFFLHYLRLWDAAGEKRVDHFITNSHFVRRRVQKVYRRDAAVIYPPVEMPPFPGGEAKGDYYLTASRLVPYKMVSLIVEAFARMPEKELHVVGDGPEYQRICKAATPNVKMLGYRRDEELRREMRGAQAFVFAAEEDFGIVMVEAQACGTPVIAYGKGGALESVLPGMTGLFFQEQTAAAICASVNAFATSSQDFLPQKIRQHAERFSAERFRAQLGSRIGCWWDEFAHAKNVVTGTDL